MDLKKEVKIMQTNTIFSVFVENLSELNEGNMVGCWVDFPCDYDEWKKVLVRSETQKKLLLQIQKIIQIQNLYQLMNIAAIATFKSQPNIQSIYKMINIKKIYLQQYNNSVTSNFEEAKEAVEKERYTLMQNYTMAEYCEMLAKECYTIPDELAPYIDWEGYAHDFSTSGYTETEKGVLIEEY